MTEQSQPEQSNITEEQVEEILSGWQEKVRDLLQLEPGFAMDELHAQPRENLVWFAFAALTMLHEVNWAAASPSEKFAALDRRHRGGSRR